RLATLASAAPLGREVQHLTRARFGLVSRGVEQGEPQSGVLGRLPTEQRKVERFGRSDDRRRVEQAEIEVVTALGDGDQSAKATGETEETGHRGTSVLW